MLFIKMHVQRKYFDEKLYLFLLHKLESLIGYYKYPYECEHTIAGSCKYLLMWLRTASSDEIRFAIIAKDVEKTAIGFSATKQLVGINILS